MKHNCSSFDQAYIRWRGSFAPFEARCFEALCEFVRVKSALPPDFARGNGRLEAKEVDVPTTYPGRPVPEFTELSALEQTRGDQLVAVVNLYKALGGSWKRKDEEWRAPK